ncbi:helix-turn-helix domain-containing protein [Sphingobacterium siyangense]|jgi:AraC-like DNA-binding protein|uniref:helix-turn-helix domain-containing protein n=1 Tax=Sphingobacterium siyangense TaxID=459529 RepID=UPI0028A7677E|nr:helix-turn-helix domain-containing protein [Sphingobacterium siyangense]
MTNKIFNIKEFASYLNVTKPKNEDLLIINYEHEDNLRLQSDSVTIDFYLLAIKPPLEKNFKETQFLEDQAKSFMYVDCPQNNLDWDINAPNAGYNILVSAKYVNKLAKDYNFVHYNNHEALFLTTDEEVILWDLYKKTYHEFQKEFYSKDIIMSYIALILSYTQVFYDRQFDSRSREYNSVIDNFYKNLKQYFGNSDGIAGLPSVAYFAQKANLSPNYFGDLIKHFTGESPIEHIHNFVLNQAKDKLKNTSLSISEISYSLGFDYPNYFARFFRKKTGLSPKVFREM